MTKYLLDTTVLIDFSKGWEPVVSTIGRLVETESVGVCAINVAEFYSGGLRGQDTAFDDFLDSLIFWPIAFESSILAGLDRFAYSRMGRRISTADALIGAVCRREDAILVTANVKDFPMEGLQVLPLSAERR